MRKISTVEIIFDERQQSIESMGPGNVRTTTTRVRNEDCVRVSAE
jgi:hypothetical protein